MSSYPPDPELPREYPPGDYSPAPDPYASAPGVISGRVTPPAVALLVVAVINLLLSLGMFGFGFVYSQVQPAQMEELLEKQNPGNVAKMRQAGISMETFLSWYVYGGFGGGAVGLFASLLTILGSIRMMMMKSYGLAVFASVLMALPCISPTACCFLGEGIGIWSLVVLLNPEVRSAFR